MINSWKLNSWTPMIGYENCLCTDSVSLCVSEKLSRNVAIIVLKHTRCIFCKVSRIPKAQESMRQSITKDLSQSVKTGNRFFLSRRIFNWRLWHRNFMRRYKKHISISQMCACTARTGKLRNFIIECVTKNVYNCDYYKCSTRPTVNFYPLIWAWSKSP